MTPSEFQDALKTLGWSPSVLADQLTMNERQARRWKFGENRVPDRVAAWLLDLAACHKARPPPPFNVLPPRGKIANTENSA